MFDGGRSRFQSFWVDSPAEVPDPQRRRRRRLPGGVGHRVGGDEAFGPGRATTVVTLRNVSLSTFADHDGGLFHDDAELIVDVRDRSTS